MNLIPTNISDLFILLGSVDRVDHFFLVPLLFPYKEKSKDEINDDLPLPFDPCNNINSPFSVFNFKTCSLLPKDLKFFIDIFFITTFTIYILIYIKRIKIVFRKS